VNRDDLLTRLARLDSRDRAWLLGELPPALRRELIDELAGDEDRAHTRAAPVAAPQPAGWEALDPRRVAELLEAEPVWLVSAATRGSEPRWRAELLQAMNTRRRHEMELADRTGRPLNARAAGIVFNACRDLIAAGVSRHGVTAPRGGFAALVEQMKSRFA
jgi:hypothetical protein